MANHDSNVSSVVCKSPEVVLMPRRDFLALPSRLFCMLNGVPHVLASVGGKQVFTPVQVI